MFIVSFARWRAIHVIATRTVYSRSGYFPVLGYCILYENRSSGGRRIEPRVPGGAGSAEERRVLAVLPRAPRHRVLPQLDLVNG